MAPQQRRVRCGRLTVVAATVVASIALAAGPGIAAGVGRIADPPTPAPTAPATTTPAAPATPVTGLPPTTPAGMPSVLPAPIASTPAPGATASATGAGIPPFGAFLDSGPRGVARMAEMSQWLGGTELKVAHTYLPGNSWRDIEGPPGFLEPWAQWRREKADRVLVLNVPMQEHNEDHLTDAQVRPLLRLAAVGAFDRHFLVLAQRLMKLQAPDTVIVLGWEMNGTTYTHRCGPDPKAWKTYWNRIVRIMRSVPGQKFRFDFTPSRGRDAVPWTECYPGDDTVDIIGMDSYDQPTGMSFDEQVKEPYGLEQQVAFAKSRGKPISYPEWGLFRNGDNADYMRRMLAWIAEHKPLYNTVTDYCPHGVWQCTDNPRSSEVYRAALYGLGDQPSPVPTDPTPVTPPTDEPVATPPVKHQVKCSPLNLGDWVEYWLGRKICVRLPW
ncbi:glycosyl hydrolase [Streptomyces sp. NPDC049915]|uniref:glycoside hydrolase family 26 protein n=1 Tax=Streptomyces sp. NPDC049915 TaxID=3155510 RepID=UPI003434FF73